MPKWNSAQTAPDLLVLTILDRRGPLHGYGIVTAIKELSEDALRIEEAHCIPHCIAWKRLVGSRRNGKRAKPIAAPGSTGSVRAGRSSWRRNPNAGPRFRPGFRASCVRLKEVFHV